MDRRGERQVGTSAVGREQWDGRDIQISLEMSPSAFLCLAASPILPEALGHLPRSCLLCGTNRWSRWRMLLPRD